MSFKLCDIIKAIDNFSNNPEIQGGRNSIGYSKYYCPDNNCDTDVKKVISTFIFLVTLLNGADNYENLEIDKMVEYAILWLSYKLNQKIQNGTTKLHDFYTKHIKTNSKYNEHITNDFKINQSVIENKIKSMNMNIKDISNFYDPFKSLCNMYIEVDASNRCMTCLKNAGAFFENCEKLKNTLDITKGSSYSQLWYSLSNDYDKFKDKYNSVKCSDVPSLVACPPSPVTKNTLISTAIIFFAASILLGVYYKHSLFGFRRKVQKNLRKKLKSLRRKWIISI
ncbi:BIR protein [Plasmodium berghei ANKA]|uniref:BIR protein n=1 Tax=Plasmodium berghei (strain Anka) TaxID=5823 RepID=A0A509AR52_PLABA|nr:BIR protein [Plasmodium berghei ANKA]XP_034424487.1 BIR protein [Plasmodium berghei ANKA]VUC58050.1 BIR protein [Plasmodium berghei ANKA]VUC58726.1 BIR protein [Plasmodium berghei ANKA]|eukprot:XP_034423816.1 BIR protein [Plasmodium berghei ANKA]